LSWKAARGQADPEVSSEDPAEVFDDNSLMFQSFRRHWNYDDEGGSDGERGWDLHRHGSPGGIVAGAVIGLQ
jgi:hypothetical protein